MTLTKHDGDEWAERVYYVNKKTKERTYKLPEGAKVAKTDKEMELLRKVVTTVISKKGKVLTTKTEEVVHGNTRWEALLSDLKGFVKVMTWGRPHGIGPLLSSCPSPPPPPPPGAPMPCPPPPPAPRATKACPPPPPPPPPAPVKQATLFPPPTPPSHRVYYKSTAQGVTAVMLPPREALFALIRGEVTEEHPKRARKTKEFIVKAIPAPAPPAPRSVFTVPPPPPPLPAAPPSHSANVSLLMADLKAHLSQRNVPTTVGFQKIMTWSRQAVQSGPPPPPPQLKKRALAPPQDEAATYYRHDGSEVKLRKREALLALIRGEVMEKPPRGTYYDSVTGAPVEMDKEKALLALIRREIKETLPGKVIKPKAASHEALLALIRGEWREEVVYSPVRGCSVLNYVNTRSGESVPDLTCHLERQRMATPPTRKRWHALVESSSESSDDDSWALCSASTE